MYFKDKHKKVISIIISLAFIFQLIPGFFNSNLTLANSEVRTLEEVSMIPENNGFVKLEVLKDAEGKANITKDSITWKLIYNASKNSLEEQSVKLFLSEGIELKYIDNDGFFDIYSQPIFKNELFEPFDSLVKNDNSLKYSYLDENVNNSEFVKSFYKAEDRTYVLDLSETEETQEIIFTTSLTDKVSNEFYAYILYEDQENGVEIKSAEELKVKPRAKIDLPVNISWENIPEELELPDIELSLVDADQLIDSKILVSGSGFTLFEDLYKYDIDGNEIDYKLEQKELEDYETIIDGFDIVNTYSKLEIEEFPKVVPETTHGEKFTDYTVDAVEKSDELDQKEEQEIPDSKTEVIDDNVLEEELSEIIADASKGEKLTDVTVDAAEKSEEDKEVQETTDLEKEENDKKVLEEELSKVIGDASKGEKLTDITVDAAEKSKEDKEAKEIEGSTEEAKEAIEEMAKMGTMSLMGESELPPTTDTKNYIKIIVTDPSNGGAPVKGARFTLLGMSTASAHRVSMEGTTDDAGVLIFKGLHERESMGAYATYIIRQVQAPFGYGMDSTPARQWAFPIGNDPRVHVENFENELIPVAPDDTVKLEEVIPEYERNNTGINAGTYSVPYHQLEGISIEEELYRNRDNVDDLRHTDSLYSIPAYSKHKFGEDIDMSADRDVIENDKAYIWKTATPTGVSGEYFIDLVVEGKERTKKLTTDIVLVLDTSGSMTHKSHNGKTRMKNLQDGVNSFLDELDLSPGSGIRVGIVSYALSIKGSKELGASKEELKSFVNTQTATGATFTQLGLMKGNELLRESTADNKALILVSDGEPTASYKINNLSTNGSVDSEGYIGKNGEHLGTRDYGNAVIKAVNDSTTNPVTIYGNGAYYGLTQSTSQPALHRQYDVYFDELNEKKKIDTHGIATVSEAESIKNHGIEIFSLAVEPYHSEDDGSSSKTYYTPGFTDLVNPNIKTGILEDILTGEDNYFTIEHADTIGQILSHIKPVSDKTIIRGKLDDPMGSQVILGKADNGEFNRSEDENLIGGNYHLSASDSSLLNNVILLKEENDKINLDGFTLGQNEWIKLRYKVNLRTELDGEGNVQDPNFEEKFYLTNGEDTTLKPDAYDIETYDFGVPAIKLDTIDIEIKKNWLGFKDDEILDSVDFKLEKSIDGDNWIDVDTITLDKPDNIEDLRNWSKKIEGLIRFDNKGNEYGYRITELTTGDFTTDIDYEHFENGDYIFHVVNAKPGTECKAIKIDKQTGLPLKGAQFKLYRDIELTQEVGTATSDEDGLFTFANLEDGTYYLKETVAPEGYDLIDAAIKVIINNNHVTIEDDPEGRWEFVDESSSGNPIKLRVYNEKKTNLTISKIDDKGQPVITDTAIFDIYKEADFTVDGDTGKVTINEGAIPLTSVETDLSTGKATTDDIFAVGVYAVVERKHPTGYIGLKEPVIIMLEESGNSVTWTSDYNPDAYFGQYNGGLFVINRPLELPNTGGVGGMAFAISGALLMAAVYIIKKKTKLKFI